MEKSKITTAIKQALVFLVLLHVIAIIAYFIIYERFAPLDFISPFFKSNFLFWSWANFDGEHYLSIAKYGYQIRSGFPQYAFFPLLPLLIKLASFIFRDYLLAGRVVSFISLTSMLYLVSHWLPLVSKSSSKQFAYLLLLSPGAVFLGSIYTEVLYLALTLAVFYFSEKKSWFYAALYSGLVTATRINGLMVAGYLLIQLYLNKKSLFEIMGYLSLAVSGFLSYLVFLYFKTGDYLAFYHSQAYWGKATATSPLTTIISYFRAITIDFTPDLVHLVVVFEVVITLWAAYLVYLVIKGRLLSPAYWLYLLGNLALPIITGSLGSMPRFFLLLFPAHLAVLKMPRLSRKLVYTVYTLMMITGTILFTRGHWYA